MKIKTIEETFIGEGYVSIPFSLNGVGHPLIKATLANNVQANFLLDTGAAVNLLDYEFAKELKLSLTPTGEKGGGAGGLTYEIFSLEKISLEVSGQHFRFDSFFSMDFSSIKESVTFQTFFQHASLNPNAHLITGVICGYRVEEIEDTLTQQVRYLDKLVDELAKGRKMEKILRGS